ncbi:hypothetical protein [Cognatilysobacter terrigena]|uniref:hypothetical protein n=1 Tax=Cognatilysobacter terrigena TaxID=2488749 RepID=UPI001414D807|nr:hypothetical protein [Lysobacter terrigena]
MPEAGRGTEAGSTTPPRNGRAWRQLHRVLALVVGLQALLWMASGLYMTAISIDVIHGDHVTRHRPALLPAGPFVPPATDDAVEAVRLKALADGRAVYEIRGAGRTQLQDARTGASIAPLDAAGARALAQQLYTGQGAIADVRWLTHAPREVGSRPAPMWQVTFDDAIATTLYLAPDTHERLATRHDLWRAFDVLWMLHIMDYREREDIGTPWLRVLAALGLAFALAGVGLLRFTVGRRR